VPAGCDVPVPTRSAAISLSGVVSRPDVLVLGGGGVLGEAWMTGVLAGIEDAARLDLRACEYFLGTSAGALVAAHLAAGRRPRRPRPSPAGGRRPGAGDASGDPPSGAAAVGARQIEALALGLAGAVAPLALALAAPGGATLRAVLLAGVRPPARRLDGLRAQVERLGASFDGRLRVVAVDRGSGRRVVFGSPGAPQASVADAVTASCAVPWLFAPVRIAGRDYVDGGAWSPTNIDAAPARRGAHVLCLNPTGSLRGGEPAGTLGALLTALRRASRTAAAVEALALRGKGARVVTVAPDHDSARAMGADLMEAGRATTVLSAGYRQGWEVARRSG
jgi:NTE family protein